MLVLNWFHVSSEFKKKRKSSLKFFRITNNFLLKQWCKSVISSEISFNEITNQWRTEKIA